MTFTSILFPGDTGPGPDDAYEPDSFHDLNLDQIISSVTAGWEYYNLRPFFYTPLASVDAVESRQAVLRDLENPDTRKHIDSFARNMQATRECIGTASRLRYRYQNERLFLDGILSYADAVMSLAQALNPPAASSPGLQALRGYLAGYLSSAGFRALRDRARQLDDSLSGIRYRLHIKGSRVRVTAYDDEPGYAEEIRAIFGKFRYGRDQDYLSRFHTLLEMDDVQAEILDYVAGLHPGIFRSLDEFCTDYRDFTDPVLARFDREVQFFLAYLDYLAPLRAEGLSFCYPQVSAGSGEVRADDTFDLALAHKLRAGPDAIVGNDLRLRDGERILVITGPNQGGKTTFARALGQLHYLAGVGLLVPGREARLMLARDLVTHFGRGEYRGHDSGQLHDDLQRIRVIAQRASPDSVIILNEIFTATTASDALQLSERVLEQVAQAGSLCVCVTFLEELASFSSSTVSMVSTVAEDNPALRTFKILRRPADGLAFAAAIAEQHGLTYATVKARVTE